MYLVKSFFVAVFLFLCGLPNSFFEQGEQLFQAKEYAQAAVCFEKHLAEHPNHASSLEYLGDIAAHLQQWTKAQSYYATLQRLHPKEANYHYKYGAALAMQAKNSNVLKAYTLLDKIEKALLTATQISATHIDSRWALVHFYLEIPALVGGSEAKAQQYASQLLAISPVDGHLARGAIAVYFKRYPEAEKHLLKAHSIGNSPTTFQKLNALYTQHWKQPEKAKALQQKFQK